MPIAPTTTTTGASATSTLRLHNGNHHIHSTSSKRTPSPHYASPSWSLPPAHRTGKGMAADGRGHSHSRSLSEVIQTSRKRATSVSAGEVVTALKAPVSYKLIVLCVIWYLASALSNTSSKSILNALDRPVTLTIVQFGFVASWCILLAGLARVFPALGRAVPGLHGGLRYPSRQVIMTTAPLAFFQVGGHIASSVATSKIPVSLVHTIKGMSPLFTVAAYRFMFQIHYSVATYLSLVPLTIGVMLACSIEFHGNFFSILMAFLGAIIFVSQNIFSKKLFNESSSTAADPTVPLHRRKLDKLNLLCYSSGIAFLLTTPLWLYSEGFSLLGEYVREEKIELSGKGRHGEAPLTGWGLLGEFIFNGTVHFGQNIIAFVLLSMVSPVTYSVASLVKRIFVIVVAIVWFGQSTTNVQAVGIGLTFLGLYLYDRAGDVARGEKIARAEQLKNVDPLLPLNRLDTSRVDEDSGSSHRIAGFANGYTESPTSLKSPLATQVEGVNGTAIARGGVGWMSPGTRQDETWRPRETAVEG